MKNDNAQRGTFYGVGVGPGDPELVTLKAARLITEADVLVYLVNDKKISQAKNIVESIIAQRKMPALELSILMPMAVNPEIGNEVYDQAAVNIETHLQQNHSVVFLCEGDPLFFGSFGYLLQRLKAEFNCSVVPGISSPHAASSALQLPLTMLKESFAVISGRHTDEQITQTLINHDSVVIMKAGRARPRLLSLLEKTQRINEANYLEFIGRENQVITTDVTTLDKNEVGPYFSLFVVIRSERQR
jgi:precorrin-2/cobalt-factor-2 C20-methyltransferase